VAALATAPASASALCNGLAPTITGTGSGETIPGTPGDDVIEAGDGDDIVNGGGGSDTICGEDGSDTINGEGGNDWLDGGDSGTSGDTATFEGTASQLTADLVTGTASTIAGESDAISNFENLTGTATFDTLSGDAGPNVLTGLGAADNFQGRGGDDTLVDPAFPADQGAAKYPDATGPVTGSIGNGTHTVTGAGVGTDTLVNIRGIEGSPFGDQLTADGSINGMHGLAGDDVIEPGGAGDIVTGGEGTDRITYATEGAVVLDLSQNSATTATGTDNLSEFENVTGSPEGDSITGDGNANAIEGLDGDDTLNGAGGTDTVSFASLASGVAVNLVADTATGQGTDSIPNLENVTGSSGNDTITGDASSNLLQGGGGTDTASFGGVATAVTASLVSGLANGQGTDGLLEIENVTGSSAGDTITGDGSANTLDGADGTDTVSFAGLAQAVTANLVADTATGQGTDSIPNFENATGSSEGDTITGDGADNVMDGLGGTDTVSFAGLAQAVTVDLVADTATGQGTDSIPNFENARGSDGNDWLGGDAGSNLLDGGAGTDTASFEGLATAVTATLMTGMATGQGTDTLPRIENLFGSTQNDTLVGNGGPNTITGLDGDDELVGGPGSDILNLGPGADTVTANDGEVDVIECESQGPDSGTVDGPAPAESYFECDTDGDARVDFLDACPIEAGTGPTGCPVTTNPPQTDQPQPPATKRKKCKRGKKAGGKKCKKKKKKRT
jgi:Ca2+-binding RTX toxin-like protein